jgi:23S rRNA pseudouridine1911/1915/1917 synthase
MSGPIQPVISTASTIYNKEAGISSPTPQILQILYEDADIVVLNKPAGIASEAVQNAPNASTVQSAKDALLSCVPSLLCSMWNNPNAYVGVVHRLDVGVSGVMVYAKTPAAAAGLSRQIIASQEAYVRLDGRASVENAESSNKKSKAHSHEANTPCFIKEYRAVIAGAPDEALPPEGLLRDYLFKDSRKGRVFAVSRPRKGVREAVLEYAIQGSAAAGDQVYSLVSITLHTGRTHQIRVQFASRKHSLWGDGKYGSRAKGAIALQSARLCFAHPRTGQPMEFTVPMPEGEPWALFCKI